MPDIVSTHAHYVYPDFYEGITMRKLISVSYPGWLTQYPGTDEALYGMFDRLVGNGCFYWLCRSMGDLYNGGEIMTRENWRQIEKTCRQSIRPIRTSIIRSSAKKWV